MTFWLSKKLVLAVENSLASGEGGRVAGVGLGKLAKTLRSRGHEIEDLDHDQEGQASFAVILVEDIATRGDWAQELSRLRAWLAPWGRLISVDKGAPAEVSRRFLCAGLSDLSQQEVGRQVLTTGTAP